jgi:hypothetical protein
MVLDRPLTYQVRDLDFSNAPPAGAAISEGGSRPAPSRGLGTRIP